MKSIVLFGDSMLGQFRKPLIAHLEAEVVGDATVYNCAAGGWDSNDGARRVDMIAKLRPDVVVLSFGGNDFAPWKRVEPERFAANIRTIVDAFGTSEKVGFLTPSVVEQPDTGQGRRTNADLETYRGILRDALPVGQCVEPDEVLARAGVSAGDIHKPDGLHLTDAAYFPLISEVARIISRG